MTKIKFLPLSFLLAQSLVSAHVVRADTGPKPRMDFEFKQELTGEPVVITSGTLYECDQSDCRDAEPLQELGPQRFTCDANRCSATAYGFAPFHLAQETTWTDSTDEHRSKRSHPIPALDCAQPLLPKISCYFISCRDFYLGN